MQRFDPEKLDVYQAAEFVALADDVVEKLLGRKAERENMLLPTLTALGFSRAEATERASDVLERVGERA